MFGSFCLILGMFCRQQNSRCSRCSFTVRKSISTFCLLLLSCDALVGVRAPWTADQYFSVDSVLVEGRGPPWCRQSVSSAHFLLVLLSQSRIENDMKTKRSVFIEVFNEFYYMLTSFYLVLQQLMKVILLFDVKLWDQPEEKILVKCTFPLRHWDSSTSTSFYSSHWSARRPGSAPSCPGDG